MSKLSYIDCQHPCIRKYLVNVTLVQIVLQIEFKYRKCIVRVHFCLLHCIFSLLLAPISTYCNQPPASLLTNAVVSGNYYQSLGSVASLMCAFGYQQPTSLGAATCTALNTTSGNWTLSNSINCSCKLTSIANKTRNPQTV